MGCNSSSHNPPKSPVKKCTRVPSVQIFSLLKASELEERLVQALKERKSNIDKEDGTADVFSFAKIILRFGSMERALKHVEAVYHSVVDGGRAVSKEELKEALSTGNVTLDSVWADDLLLLCDVRNTNLLGLREFLVMLAVGRLCQVMPQVSTVLDVASNSGPHNSGGQMRTARVVDTGGVVATPEVKGKANGISGGMTAINENEERTPSMVLYRTHLPGRDVGVGQNLQPMREALDDHKEEEQKDDDDASNNDDRNNSIMVGVGTGKEEAAVARAEGRGGGLPRMSSFNRFKWKRIPSMMQLNSGAPAEKVVTEEGTGKGEAVGDTYGDMEKTTGCMDQYAGEVMYVVDLITAAYLQFDHEANGYISRHLLEEKLREAEREGKGGGHLLEPTKWGDLVWDDGGRLSFQEFVYGFSNWMDLEEEEEEGEEDQGKKGAPQDTGECGATGWGSKRRG